MENLDYKGFELYYLKAVYFFNTKENCKALNQINQAIEFNNEDELIMLKARILRQQKNPDYEKIEKMEESVRKDYFQYGNLKALVNKVNEIAGH